MNWLNLRTEILHSPEFIGCHPTRRATWLSLSLWCASQENGGIVAGGAAVKLKVAASQFTEYRFHLVTRQRGGGWRIEEVLA